MTFDCCVFNFLRRCVNGKHLMRFQGETSVFKFLRRSVDGALNRVLKHNIRNERWQNERNVNSWFSTATEEDILAVHEAASPILPQRKLQNSAWQYLQTRFYYVFFEPWGYRREPRQNYLCTIAIYNNFHRATQVLLFRGQRNYNNMKFIKCLAAWFQIRRT